MDYLKIQSLTKINYKTNFPLHSLHYYSVAIKFGSYFNKNSNQF